jgi:hypothetical protein
MGNDRNYAALPHEYLEEMQPLSDAEFGRLVRSLLAYSKDGTQIALSGNERFYAARVMNCEDRFQQSFSDKSRNGKNAASARWNRNANACEDMRIDANACEPMQDDANACETMRTDANRCERMRTDATNTKTNTKTNTNTKTKTNTKANNIFRPPTLEDVRAYCLERGNTVDPVKFWSYYDAGDWKDAKGNPVRNWKQKLLTWENKTEDHRKSSADSLQGAYDMIERWANG